MPAAACGREDVGRELDDQPSPALPAADVGPVEPAPAVPAGPPETAEAGPREAADSVVRRYYELLGKGEFVEARGLWDRDGEASGMSPDLFETTMLKYQSLSATVGEPGEPEGAAGSIYVETPVSVRAVIRGEPTETDGVVVLRRCNHVPGCTGDDLSWRIHEIRLDP